MPSFARSSVPGALPCLAAAIVLTGLAGLAAQRPQEPIVPPVITVPAGAAAVEQTAQGDRAAAAIAERFDGRCARGNREG